MSMGEPWSQKRVVLRELLRLVRKEQGVIQTVLAERLKKPQSYVSKIESSEQRMDLVELQEWCHACGVDLQSFIKRFEEILIAKNL